MSVWLCRHSPRLGLRLVGFIAIFPVHPVLILIWKAGEGKAYNHRNVTRASASTSLDQDWYIRISSIDDGYKVYALPQNAETGNVNLIWYDDGNLLLSYSLEGENTPHFVVFEEKTGRFSECGLHYHANDRELPVCVVGEIPAQDSYLVLCDEVTVDSVSNLYSGARTAPVYAQIKKEEYWAGNKFMCAVLRTVNIIQKTVLLILIILVFRFFQQCILHFLCGHLKRQRPWPALLR